jgi:uncharacterized protein YndB with AHSA1/START domain
MSAIEEIDYGQLEVKDGRSVVSYQRRFPHPPSKVWRALTEDEHLAAWFPTTIEGERAVGARLTFRHRDLDLPPMAGEITAFDPPRLLELTWGGDELKFELEPDGEGTALTFTATMAELGKAARDGAGWHVCLNNLAYVLAGEPAPGADPGGDWPAVNRVYQERFGPEASTLGPPKEWEDANRRLS